MPIVEDHLDTAGPTGLSPAPPVEDLIPEVREHTRRRRRRNLAIVLLAAAIVAGLITVTDSGSPVAHHPAGSASPSSTGSPLTERSSVVPKQPASLAVGPTGVLYMADQGRQQILRRSADGRFRIVAGDGVTGYSGDGRLATQAELDAPTDLAIAQNGAIYFTQAGRTKNANGLLHRLVREITPNGKITTVTGHPQLSLSGGLVRSSANSIRIPKSTSEYCGAGVPGPGFIAFGCESGAGRGPRLMVVRSNGTAKNYLSLGSQADDMSVSNGDVVAIHNGAIVRVGVNGLSTIASQRQLTQLVPGATGDWPGVGIAIDRRGNVYVDQDFLIARHGCADVIFEIAAGAQPRRLWRSGRTDSCY
jgi:hypothetical protein